MKKFGLRLVVNGISLYLVSILFAGIEVEITSLVILTLVFCLLNTLVKPVLSILSLPITIISLGLFTFVLNGLMLWFAFKLVNGASVDGVMTCVLASIVISVLNNALEKFFKK